MLEISRELSIPLAEIELTPIRAQGAGGQNVNKVSSAIHLRFAIAESATLPDDIKERLLALNDSRISSDGVIVIKAQRFRTQEKNRADALQRLRELIQSAMIVRKKRRKTRPSRASVERRLQSKNRRATTKRDRGKPEI